MRSTIKRPSPVQGAQDVFTVCDLPAFADIADAVPASDSHRQSCHAGREWTGCKDYDESVRQVRQGDLSGVAASDRLMEQLENQIALSRKWQNTMDVVGGCPNIPVYLSGQPINMRTRRRVMSEYAPLCVFVSLELSAGIDADTMRKRGASALALVRLLANVRPVELYVCCSVGGTTGDRTQYTGRGRRRRSYMTGGHGYGSHILVKLDTAPLDLARAAHVLTCPSVTRGLCYALLDHQGRAVGFPQWAGNWSYANVDAYRRTALDNFKSVVNPSAQAILLPAAHASDPCVNDPVTWLKDMLREYGGVIEE